MAIGRPPAAEDPALLQRKFGTLTVVKLAPRPEGWKRGALYLCECSCAYPTCQKTCIVRRDHLISGNTKSCPGNKNAHQTIESVKQGAYKAILSRGRYNDGNITLEQFIQLASSDCHYCGVKPFKLINDFERNPGATAFAKEHGSIYWNGLDRINSALKHDFENVVPCCYPCNSFKLDRDYQVTLDHIQRLNPDFEPVFCESLTAVKEQIEKTKMMVNPPRAKTWLGRAYPERYGEGRAYLQWRVSILCNNARRDGIFMDLSDIDVAELMLANCIYCGSPPDMVNGKFNGIDRYINHNDEGRIGYLKSNSVTACHYCNSAKRELAIDEFREWMKRIKEKHANA